MQDDAQVGIMFIADDIVVAFYQDDLQPGELTAPKHKPIPVVVHIAVEKVAQEDQFLGRCS
jgi:hypothetical protein